MPQMHNGRFSTPDDQGEEDLERLLIEGISLQDVPPPATRTPKISDEVNDVDTPMHSDVQGALALYAEAAQDMATAGVELGLGRHFACVDYCNQAVEKAAQAVSLLRFGRRSTYDHDLGALGARVGAPREIQDKMAALTPFHPEAFYMDTPPEEADGIISAELAQGYVQSARAVMRWARDIVLRV